MKLAYHIIAYLMCSMVVSVGLADTSCMSFMLRVDVFGAVQVLRCQWYLQNLAATKLCGYEPNKAQCLLQNSRKEYNSDSEKPAPWKWFKGNPDNPYKVFSSFCCPTRSYEDAHSTDMCIS